MTHDYVGLATHENENKMVDIENNITQTLLANKDVERKNKTCGCNSSQMMQIGFITIFAVSAIVMLLIIFHVITIHV
jgi:hypothetical protein